MGDYIIQEQYISSDDCDNCLYIKVYEGCNRYHTYYFQNEHIINERFSKGDVVNIRFRSFEGESYVNGIKQAIKYRTKC